MTGGHIKRIQEFIDGTFMLMYGDGLSNVDLKSLLQFHSDNNRLATVIAIQRTAKFGALHLSEDASVYFFQEKPKINGAWIKGGFFVLEPGIFNYIS
jgi:glucose-1-phosphate cytidylyltransferase